MLFSLFLKNYPNHNHLRDQLEANILACSLKEGTEVSWEARSHHALFYWKPGPLRLLSLVIVNMSVTGCITDQEIVSILSTSKDGTSGHSTLRNGVDIV